MSNIEEDFKALSSMPLEQLFDYVALNDKSVKKYVARFLIEKHLQIFAHELQKKANAPAERRGNLAIIISATALVVTAANFLWEHWLGK